MDPSKLPCLTQWKRDYNMETVLIELRRSVISQSSIAWVCFALTLVSQIHGSAPAQETASAAGRLDFLKLAFHPYVSLGTWSTAVYFLEFSLLFAPMMIILEHVQSLHNIIGVVSSKVHYIFVRRSH